LTTPLVLIGSSTHRAPPDRDNTEITVRMTRHITALLATLASLAVLSLVGQSLPVVRAMEAGCPDDTPSSGVLMCEAFEDERLLERWVVGSRGNTWPYAQFVLCGDGFGFNDRCAAWSNHLIFDGSWGFWGYDGRKPFPPASEFYARWYQYTSDPYAWGTLEDKSVMLHDSANTLTAYVGSSRNHLPVVPNSGPGMPFVANYQDLDWQETGGQYTRVNRFQNQGNDITLQPGRWYLFEWYVRLNTPGLSDGVTRLWIDDATESIDTQTLRLYYTDIRWLRSGDAGKQFETLRLTDYHQRCDTVPNTCPPNGPSILKQSHRWDQIVVSKTPVGPMVPPKVALTSPLPATIVSGTIPANASSLNGADLVGVQFRVDDALLIPEATAAPHSVSWDTTTVSDGPHTMAAIGRDAAGNTSTSAPVTFVVANRTTVTRVDETSAAITTSSNSWILGNIDRAWSGGTAALAFASGQRATFPFTGTGVSWIGFRGPQTGVADVYLDGTLVATIDPYSSTEQVQAVLFTVNGLPMGPHTLAIEVPSPRAKNRLSSDYFTVIDAFDVIGVSATSDGMASAGRSEQTSAAVTYMGSWISGNTDRTWSGGTASLGFASGQRATLNFIGTGASWIGFKGPQAGVANVYLDGIQVATVDAYAATEEVQAVLFSTSGLTPGLHVLAVEATGMKNASSIDRFVVVDAFDVQ
jgi:hypothetical protein